jgi:ABC-type antimicrobial peptide transport system permease subunit
MDAILDDVYAAAPLLDVRCSCSSRALALVLVVVGIYGVVSFAVAQRTHEIGIRVALGARPGDVARLILVEGLGLVALGVAAGTVAALVLGRLMAGMLFGVSPTDPHDLGGCRRRARRARGVGRARPDRGEALAVDPSVTLRGE